MIAKIRIGDIMREFGLTRATIHYYTSEGLFKLAGKTESGGALYDLEVTGKRLAAIKALKADRYKIKDIKKMLEKKLTEK